MHYNVLDKSNKLYDIILISFDNLDRCMFFKYKNSDIAEILIAKKDSVSSFVSNQVVLFVDNYLDMNKFRNMFYAFLSELEKFGISDDKSITILVDSYIEEDNFIEFFDKLGVDCNFVHSDKYVERVKIERKEVVKESNSEKSDDKVDSNNAILDNVYVGSLNNLEKVESTVLKKKKDVNKKVGNLSVVLFVFSFLLLLMSLGLYILS